MAPVMFHFLLFFRNSLHLLLNNSCCPHVSELLGLYFDRRRGRMLGRMAGALASVGRSVNFNNPGSS